MTLVAGLLAGLWIWFASTWLFWIFPLSVGASIAVGWAFYRLLRRRKWPARAVVLCFASAPVVWLWLAQPADSKFGYLIHGLATTHLLVLFVAIGVTAVQWSAVVAKLRRMSVL
jgi:hypothetical protein